ncbi:MAG TPA: adenylate/guanylate cyclase domain-containing protein [Solirubrobacteraceae bacterium]|nr:adenylate/guanylate cyclase domain-containing protein [Solirubrobacteraceae bacterium]
MPETESGALERGREAFERRAWGRAFDQLHCSYETGSLAPEDLERLGEAARWSRHFDEMFDIFERASAAYENGGDRRSAARVAVKLTVEHHARQGDALAAGWLARAGRLLEGEPACRERGLVLMCVAQGMFFMGNGPAALEIGEQMVQLGRELEDRDIEALGRLALGHARLLVGQVREGTALIDEAMAAALGGELELWTTGQIFCSTIFACRNRGDWGRAGEWSVASLRWCERQSLSGFPGLCRFHRAEVMRFRGELDRAERDASEAVDELLVAAPRWAAFGLHELGEIRRRRGDLKGAMESFRHSAELGFDPHPGLALLRLDEEKPAVARRAISQALADENGLVLEGRWLLLPAAVEVAIAAGDAELARSALEELEGLAESLDTTAVRAAAVVASGRLALSESRADDAVRELRRGVRLWSEIDVPYEAAQARELLAGAYADLGDQDAAELELTAARASFERIGAERAKRRVAALLSRAGKAPHAAVRTFMFTDIVDSTRLVETLGDEQWESLLAWHDRTLRECFEACAGEEVKHEGDGFFVAFAESESALDCACSIQRSLRDHRRDHGFAPRVRIGIHATDATDRGGDYGGRGVHMAARIAAAAGPGEIIASREALDAASYAFRTLDERPLDLKGIARPVTVATVDWSDGY